jgi:hypothetical protein
MPQRQLLILACLACFMRVRERKEGGETSFTLHLTTGEASHAPPCEPLVRSVVCASQRV